MIHYVCGCLFSEDRTKLCLVLKNRPLWQAGKYNFPGGKVELGEIHSEAIEREFQEETGVHIGRKEWKAFMSLQSTNLEWRVQFYKFFSDKIFDVRTMESESIEIHDVKSLPSNLMKNLKWIIPLALDTDNLFAIVNDGP